MKILNSSTFICSLCGIFIILSIILLKFLTETLWVELEKIQPSQRIKINGADLVSSDFEKVLMNGHEYIVIHEHKCNKCKKL